METFPKLTKKQDEPVASFSDKVEMTLPAKDRTFPFMITRLESIDCIAWAEAHKNEINELLLKHGAILLRGFEIGSAQKFNDLFSTIVGQALEYKNRTSPREQVFKNVYTSTSHPNDQVIHMHTENSYSKATNRILAFYCLVPPSQGGETPIADERELLTFLKEETKLKFKNKKIQYVRNVVPGIGLDLKSIYQTDNKEELNKIFRDTGVDHEWVSEHQLRLKWVLPAFINHPVTNKEVWFNHMFFGHKSLYSQEVLEAFNEEDLPFVTYYGDGSEIEENVIQEFKDFYEKNSIVFKWQKDDFLLLDNMMYAHGRKPYSGDRTILTAMAQPVLF
jgi:alpha-ketoglutarate-dependent taurine dioxygenase